MNKNDDTRKAIEELELTNEIKILPETQDENLVKQMLKTKTKSELIRTLLNYGYSEFIIGVIIGYTLKQEEKIEIRRGGFRRLVPSLFKKD